MCLQTFHVRVLVLRIDKTLVPNPKTAGGHIVGGYRTMEFRLLYAAMFLASCSGWQPLASYEPQSQRNYNRDLYECQREATFAGGEDNKQQVFDNCMKARGYNKT
jgi:hypothetical protein